MFVAGRYGTLSDKIHCLVIAVEDIDVTIAFKDVILVKPFLSQYVSILIIVN